MKNIKLLSGIDALYFYFESTKIYLTLYNKIKEQIDSNLRYFENNNIEFENNQILVEINNYQLYYIGKGEGFIWLRCPNEFFIIGLKHPNSKMVAQHDIRVKLLASGIYQAGINFILNLLEYDVLQGYTTGYKPITRIDLNVFIEHNLSHINKSMFVSRKQNHHQIYEDIGSQSDIATLYIGKKPFRLRIYNKTKELTKSSKKEMMEEYFCNNGLDMTKTIFNIEFEISRDFIREYKIDTVEEILSQSEILFKECCELIKMVDENKKLHPIWQHIIERYTIKEFLQSDTLLIKSEKVRKPYSIEKFIEELKDLIKKALKKHIVPKEEHFIKALEGVRL